SEAALPALRRAFDNAVFDPTSLTRAGRAALVTLVSYIEQSQKGRIAPLRPPVTDAMDRVMSIDAATRQSLELLQTQRGQAKGSLRHSFDLPVSAPSARLLASRLAAPLCDAKAINDRLDAVARLVEDTLLRGRLRADLKAAPD